MFDPNVSDSLVIEHGADAYGMIAPMETVISAAMYHDIAAMRLKGASRCAKLTYLRSSHDLIHQVEWEL